VLHIATSHHISPRWIEIQTRHLREHIPVPYRTWASLQLIDASYGAHFDRVIDTQGPDAGKLNHLALEISQEASEGDLLMFLDGDAFPVADPMALIAEGLERAPLIAARRAENSGDRQPHPCFCVTTVGDWGRLAGDWSDGYPWSDSRGRRVTDLGGNLLRRLELSSTPWTEVRRSNPARLDPLYFAVYGGVIYHHGVRGGTLSRAHRDLAPALLRAPAGSPAGRLRGAGTGLWERWIQRRYMRRSEALHARIQRGDPDWLADIG
jgi:hypothetical protein